MQLKGGIQALYTEGLIILGPEVKTLGWSLSLAMKCHDTAQTMRLNWTPIWNSFTAFI